MQRPLLMAVLTCLLFLVSLSDARHSAWEDPSGNSIFDPYKNKPPPEDAVEAWERDKECDPNYFELTHRNLNDSGIVEWYPKWMEKMKEKYPEKYQSLGEVRFFSKLAWGDSNFMCGIIHKGCATVPTPMAVVERVLLHRAGSNYTLAENLSEARRIYFMASEIHAITQFMFYQYHLFQAVKSNAMHMIDKLIEDFTQQPEAEADNICNILIMSYTTLLEIGKTVMNSFGKIPDAVSNAVMMSEALTELALNTALETGASVTSGGSNLAPLEDESKWSAEKKKKVEKTKAKTQLVAQMLAPFQKLAVIGATKGIEESHGADAAAEHQSGGEGEPWHDMAGKAATGFCSGLGGGFRNENLKRSNRLKEYVLGAFPQIQGALQDNLDSAVNWKGNGTFSPFASWVGNHDWSLHGQHRHVQHDEERATQLYLDSLMSIAWRSAHCYQKCLCDPMLDRNKYRNPMERTAKYRYYPEDEENCVCQPQCWHATRRSPFEKRLFGINKLSKYHHNITDISRMSYSYYRANGNNYKRPNMDLRHEPIEAEAGISLPHCVSSQLRIGDFDDESKGWRIKLLSNNNRRFPCTCGNWMSNETESFMEIFSMGKGQKWMTSHAGDELFKQVCPENLKALPPLNHYLAFCKLGIRWPHNGGILYIKAGQTDKYCGDIMNYYSSWIDHPREANKDFCTRNKVAKKIFKSQKIIPSVETSPGLRDVGVEHKCKAWLAKEEKKKEQKIIVPQELIIVSEYRTEKGNFEVENGTNETATRVRGNGVFETVTLNEGPKPTTVVVEESVEQVTVDLYDEETTTEEASPTTLLAQDEPKVTTSVNL